MKRLAIIFVLFCINTYFTQAQTTMTIEQLDSLCLSMTDNIRLNTPVNITDDIPIPLGNHSFVPYLHNAYYTTSKQPRTATKKQLPEGTLLRLAEGKLTTEEAENFRSKSKYLLPTEMTETEYFFFNNQLIKISLTVGHTDYNYLPQNYWIMVNQLDLIYYTEPKKKATYHINCNRYATEEPTQEEWGKILMTYANITEEQLLANAYLLYKLYCLNHNLFNK